MENNQTIKLLFQRYLNGECNSDEIKALLKYFDAGQNEAILRELIRLQLDSNADVDSRSARSMEDLLSTSLDKIKIAINIDQQASQMPVIPIYSRSGFRAIAAAVIIMLLSSTVFYLFHQKETPVIAHQKSNIQPVTDIMPGNNNAVLTLDDGTNIMLDSVSDGTLAQQGNIKVLKLNGQIAYNKSAVEQVDMPPVYNTITTATGNQYELILSDGSKVWLNAASSIRFPTSFTGDDRNVEIKGEAYFEIAKDAKRPFKVLIASPLGKKDATEIEVLGTHFNVNAYSEEPDIKTTLLEGAVKVKKANLQQLLSPGQQASLTSDGITLKKNIDLSQVVAWKDGYFQFNNANINVLMRQVARWYDVQVDFEGNISEEGFSGKISRNVPLSRFLKLLELNDVHVKTAGKRITILP